MRRLLLPVLLLCGACWTTTRPEVPDLPAPTARPEPTIAPVLPPQAASSSAESEAPLPPLLEPLIRLHEVEGASPADAAGLLREAPDRIEKCRGIPGGVISLHLRAHKGKLSTSVQSARADPATTECILEAIAFGQDESTSPSTSPSERTRDVESMLTISW